jgi:hypothetical protein
MKEQASGDSSHRKEVASSTSTSGSSSSGQKGRPSTTDASFGEYEDNEWDVGIGNLIDDLDADIEKSAAEVSTVPGTGAVKKDEQVAGMPATGPGIPSSTRGSSKVPSTSVPSPTVTTSSTTTPVSGPTTTLSVAGTPTSTPSSMQHSATVEKGLKMKIKRTKPPGGSKSAEKLEIVKPVVDEANPSASANANGKVGQASMRKDAVHCKESKEFGSSNATAPVDRSVKTENPDFSAPNNSLGNNSSGPFPKLHSTNSTHVSGCPTPKKKPKLEQDGEGDPSSSDSSPSVSEMKVR